MPLIQIIAIVVIALIVVTFLGFYIFNFIKNNRESQKIYSSNYSKIQNQKDLNEVTALELVDIVKTYGEGENQVQALREVSLSFRKNEFVSILGPSGCGKTTMLNIIGGLDRYTSGDLIINGISTVNYSDNDWDTYRNNSIGFVFQNYNLIMHQTVLSNVEMSLTLSGVSKTERRKRAFAVLEEVGLKGQEHKLPNQLSGGQMQRVAIARALVNNPEIILADEPTGALDSDTSIQVMELLKKVAKDRLVIMVTHNPKLAEKYSTRIINLLDGQKTSDTNPFEKRLLIDNNKEEKGRAAMKTSTAFSLSLSNLRTKKGRTILTSIAGSIGIIGIALVLAVSTGFSAYINKLQADTLSVYPVTVSEATIDLADFNKLAEKTELDKFPKAKEIYTRELFGKLTNMLKSNKLTDEYLSYVKNFVNEENEKVKDTEQQWAYCLGERHGYDVNNFIYANISMSVGKIQDVNIPNFNWTMPIDQLVRYIKGLFESGMANSNLNISADFVREYIPTISRIPNNQALIKSQYDLIDGDWATGEGDLLLVVDQTNSVTDITLALLGINSIDGVDEQTYNIKFGEKQTFTFNEIYEKEFYYLKNDVRYAVDELGNVYDRTFTQGMVGSGKSVEPDLTLKVKGIVRLKDGLQEGVLSNGLAYTNDFYNRILTDNVNSEIVNSTKQIDGQKQTIHSWFIGDPNAQGGDPTMKGLVAGLQNKVIQGYLATLQMSSEMTLREIAGVDTVNKIAIYSAGYEQKENLKTHLKAWNDVEGRLEVDKVHYSDSTELLFFALNSMVDAVKIVLIAFTAISLVVSSIMIGIITYVSVVERTKEIGVLRSLGARKKDISRIFNAETFLIGLFAGLIGVGISYLLTIPINLIVGSFMPEITSLAMLKITDALTLVTISFVLTLISGVIPSRIASKKDPVVALRSE